MPTTGTLAARAATTSGFASLTAVEVTTALFDTELAGRLLGGELLRALFALHLARAEALFMGGGNTYALLKRLRESGLLSVIRERVMAGMPYLGASAGSNVAGPTILTTNDWNVVGLDRFDALGLVSFNINPHYKETDPAMAPGSETRDERIAEYHVVNANPVVGLEEGALVRVDNGVVTARGTARIKIFRQGQVPTWHQPGERLDLKV